jgi:hypothetical protein
MIRNWIVQILENRTQLLRIAVRQRAKFEGWLKFELASLAEKNGAQGVKVEDSYTATNGKLQRSDISFSFDGVRYDVELKTPNTNYRMLGVQEEHRPITKNISEIIEDAEKLFMCSGQGVVGFVLFPIPPHDSRWKEYLDRIGSELNIKLSENENCTRVSLPIAMDHSADMIVCTFIASKNL